MATASMGELTGNWITDENVILNNNDDTWADCLGSGGQLDNEKALDSLQAHGVVEDMKRDNATKFKSLTTRWEKGWKMKNSEWKMKVRFVGREYKGGLQSTRRWWCDYDVSCLGGVQQARAEWNMWPEFL